MYVVLRKNRSAKGGFVVEAYFEQELQKTVETINRLNKGHCLTFPVLADVHIHPERPEFMLRYEHTIELVGK